MTAVISKIHGGSQAPGGLSCEDTFKDPFASLSPAQKILVDRKIDELSNDIQTKLDGCAALNLTDFAKCMDLFNSVITFTNKELTCSMTDVKDLEQNYDLYR